MEVLIDEVAEKHEELEKAESSRLDTLRKAEMFELVNKILWAERENDQSMTRANEDRLKERIMELEKDNSVLHDRVIALETEKAQLLVRPSSSNAFDFPSVPRELYKEWIHAEARLDVFQDLACSKLHF